MTGAGRGQAEERRRQDWTLELAERRQDWNWLRTSGPRQTALELVELAEDERLVAGLDGPRQYTVELAEDEWTRQYSGAEV